MRHPASLLDVVVAGSLSTDFNISNLSLRNAARIIRGKLLQENQWSVHELGITVEPSPPGNFSSILAKEMERKQHECQYRFFGQLLLGSFLRAFGTNWTLLAVTVGGGFQVQYDNVTVQTPLYR